MSETKDIVIPRLSARQRLIALALKPVRIRDGHDNFFTPLRLIMAIMVMVGHTAIISLRDVEAEPHIFFDYGFSYLAVNLFFIASGFLVTKSICYRRDLPEYSSARLLRIYPALIVLVAYGMFLIGPLATTLPIWEYLTHPDVWKQPFLILSFLNTDFILPDTFSSNMEQFTSVPLWTLRYEMLAYLVTALAFTLGLMRRKWMVLAQFILPSLLWIVTKQTGLYDQLPATAEGVLRFGMAYGLGASLFAYRDKLNFHLLGLFCVTVLTVICSQIYVMEIVLNLMLAYGLMFFAYLKVPSFKALQNLPDLSYGVYIYHWSVLQLAFYWWPGLTPMALFTVAAPVTIALACGSWYLIEKPALRMKKRFSNYLRFGRARSQHESAKLLLD